MTKGGNQFRKPPSFKFSGSLFKMHDTFKLTFHILSSAILCLQLMVLLMG